MENQTGKTYSKEYYLFRIFALNVLVDTSGTCFTCSHCKDNGCCTCYSISAGIYALFGGLHRYSSSAMIHFLLVDIKTVGCGGDQRVRGSTKGHDHGIDVDGQTQNPESLPDVFFRMHPARQVPS